MPAALWHGRRLTKNGLHGPDKKQTRAMPQTRLMLATFPLLSCLVGCVSEAQVREEVARSRSEIDVQLTRITTTQDELGRRLAAVEAAIARLDQQQAGVKGELTRLETGFQSATEKLLQAVDASREVLRSHLTVQRDALAEQLKAVAALVDRIEVKTPASTAAPVK